MSYWGNKCAIIDTASAAWILGLPLMAPYAMSKHPVLGFSNSLRLEAAQNEERMNVFCPMAIETSLLETDVARELGAQWCSDIRSHLTKFGGPPYPVDAFVDYALDQIQKDKAIIVAPFGARFGLGLIRFFPSIVERMTKTTYLDMLATQPADQEPGRS